MSVRLNNKLIISDFDGTLVNDDGRISAENKQAIAEYRAAGGAFAISTGRMPYGILPRAEELGLKGLISCCQGAIIADIATKRFVFEATISHETTLAIVEKMESMGLHIHLYGAWEYYCNMDDDALKLYEKSVGYKATLVLDKPLSQYVKERKLTCYKIVAMVKSEENDRALAELAAVGFEGCTVTKSAAFLAEVINAKYSKGTAVEFLANHYGVSLAQTVAIGDQQNDLPMIEKAGIGVAVKNADASLKSVADYVSTYTNEESAVADCIERFGFKK